MFELEIKKSTAEEAVANRQLWTLDITCNSTDPDVTSKVFVYHAAAGIEAEGVAGDLFTCVSSAQQLIEYPADSAVEGVPFYRLNVATFYCRSAEERLDLENAIIEDLEDLKNNILASRQLVTDKIVSI